MTRLRWKMLAALTWPASLWLTLWLSGQGYHNPWLHRANGALASVLVFVLWAIIDRAADA